MTRRAMFAGIGADVSEQAHRSRRRSVKEFSSLAWRTALGVRRVTGTAASALCFVLGTSCASQDRDAETFNGDFASQPPPDLIAAVVADDSERIAALLAAGADIHEKWIEGITALHVGASGADMAIVKQLVTAGANVHVTAGGAAITPLHMAAANPDSAVVTTLLDAGASVDAVTNGGATPLALTVLSNNSDAARVLIEAGADVNITSPEDGLTMLHVAASKGVYGVAEVLIEAGAHLEATDATGRTPLHHAAKRSDEAGDEGVAQLLIDAGANVNVYDGSGLTALHMAVGSNRHLLAESLLDAGANIDARAESGGATALHMAAAAGCLDCVGLLLRRGATVDPLAHGMETPLLAAVEKGKEYAAVALLEHGADANVKNEDGDTVATIAERKGMTVVLAHLREADEATNPARDIDPEALVDMLNTAVKRDAPDTVLRLLDGVDATEFGFSAMHEAAGRDSVRVAQALLDAGYDANLGVGKPLHFAARHESPRVAALLIEHGAEVSARDHIGWTPLHYALLRGTDRPALRTANVLLDHGADVNATTTSVGWTPLHLAAHLSGAVVWPYSDEPSGWRISEFGHGPDVLQIVQRLLERGADVDARTRVGGWTPVRVAKASDEHRHYRHYGLEPGASSKAVVAAIQAAGGKDEGCDNTPELPRIEGGRAWRDQGKGDAAVAPGCEYNLPFAAPGVIDAGGRRVAGSFTAPGVDEAVLFAGYGTVDGGDWLRLMSLQDREGVVRPVMAFNDHMEGLCLDPETNTHAVVFRRRYDGSCCPWVDTVYYHYDADAGNLVEVFVDDVTSQPTGENVACRWRDTASGLDVYQDALSALRVGESPSWPWDKYKERNLNVEPLWEGLLPTRAVSTEVVEAQLERLRGLPDVVRVWNAELDSPDRKIVVAEYVGTPRSESVDVCEGVVLAWNEARQEWRSIYDCAAFFDFEIHDDTLSAALYVGTATCGSRRQGRSCYLEVDLTTWLAELWEEPHGNYWSNRRERPER